MYSDRPAGGARAVVLVDGEHHPPVLRRALTRLADDGLEPVQVVVLGGGEKLDEPGVPPDLGVPARWPASAEHELLEVLRDTAPDVVIDLSGPPVVEAPRRLRLAAIALAAGVPYDSPGVRYTPPDLPWLTTRPTVAVVATGKRTGKTAMSGALVRHAQRRGRTPVVVAMGRGGPPEPIVIPAGESLDPQRLLEVVEAGGHAASDFYEDAVTTGAASIGCYRVGDGPAGEVALSNVAAGVAQAEEQPGSDLTVLEGSGSALPPCAADATALIVPAGEDPGQLLASLPLRFILADAVLIGFAGEDADDARLKTLVRSVRELLNQLPRRDDQPVPEPVLTDLRPHPLGDVSGRRVFVVSTARGRAADRLTKTLEERFGATVVGASQNLADRPALLDDLSHAPTHDALVTELKAAAVDVVVRAARDNGTDVVFCDNRPEPVGGVDPDALEGAFDRLLSLADRRHRARR